MAYPCYLAYIGLHGLSLETPFHQYGLRIAGCWQHALISLPLGPLFCQCRKRQSLPLLD